MSGDGIDTEMAVAMLAVAVGLLIYGLAVKWTQSRGHSVKHIARYARRIIRERGIQHHRPLIEISDDPGHAVIRWTEDGGDHAILLTWHHTLDRDVPEED